jgi:predicted nucleic acid-binding protein
VTTYVLDASVAVAAVRPGEPFHRAARARLAALLTGTDAIVVPAIFDVEVTATLVRGQASGDAARAYLDRDLGARQLVTIGPRAARAISAVAARTSLRAADASYVWVASSRGLALVTLDQEIGKKVGTLCQVEGP